MLGFFPFLSWWGILANIAQRKKGSHVMFGGIFFNIDSQTANFRCFDQIITNNREIKNKLYLQRNEPTNMTNLPSSIPLALVVDFISYINYCIDLILGKAFCIFIFFHFPDSRLSVLKGFHFYFCFLTWLKTENMVNFRREKSDDRKYVCASQAS